MPLNVRFQIAQDLNQGRKIKFADTTGNYEAVENPGGYGVENIDAAGVIATRMVVGDYLSEKAVGQTSEFIANKEYTADEELIFDQKTFQKGETFIARTSGMATGSAIETGRRLVPNDYLPISGQITINAGGLFPSTNPEQIPDSVYNLLYQVFSDAAITNIEEGETYIVLDAEPSPGSLLYNGNLYFHGEVFVGKEATSFAAEDTAIYKLEAEDFRHFNLYYFSNYFLNEVTKKIAKECDKCRRDLLDMITIMRTDFWAMKGSVTPICLDISGSQKLMDKIAHDYRMIKKCRC